MHSRLTPLPPMVPRIGDETFQRWFGSALAKLATAEAALYNAADQHMEACRRAAEDGIPYTYGEDMRIGCIAREVMIQAWEVIPVARSSARPARARPWTGQRFERIYRDMSMLQQPPQHRAARVGVRRARARAPRPAAAGPGQRADAARPEVTRV